MSWFTDLLKDRYTSVSSGVGPTQPRLDLGNIAKDIGVAGALYGILNPNDSSGLASFFGTGGRQQPVGYTGGIPNYVASREVAPNAFAQTYTTPTGEVAPRRPGAAGRRYFTDTTFTQDTGTPFMGITAEQIAAQNQAAQDERDFFESLLGSAATQRTEQEAAAATTGTAGTAGTTAFGTLTGDAQSPYGWNADQIFNYFNQGLTPADIVEKVEGFGAVQPGTMAYDSLVKDYEYWQQTRAGSNIPDEVDQGGITQTPREFYTSILNQIDASDGLDEGEQTAIATAITEGAFGIDEIAERYDAQPVDVVEGLLRGGFQTPEQVAAMYNIPEFDEPMLIATLLDQGKTTPEEVAAYYKDHPVYGGITPEQVTQEFRARGGTRFARGGNVNGYYLGGTTDGMADQIPATINNMQPAALSDGEFVIPADVVSHLGNGNSDAGAKQLYSMMERVRKDRTGNPKQGRQIDPNKYLA